MFAFLVDHPSHLWLYIGCFGLSFSSAVLPWLSAELVVVALPAVARSPLDLAGLVVIATTGQMTGKCFVYAVGRFSIRLRSARMIVAGLLFTSTTSRPSDRSALQACVPE